MSKGEYSVVQFFKDDSYEYVRKFVDLDEAVGAFMSYANCIGAMLGTTCRVIITDGGDLTCAEWEYGKGITYPTKEDFDKAFPRKSH
jgi:hypothetical protein